MRNLYLMLGTPASGKSELIKRMNLDQYTISTDVVRNVVSTPRTVLEHSSKYDTRLKLDGVDYKDEHYVWDTVYSLVERRMSQGETTIVDATHLFKGAFKKYDKLRLKYNYKVFLINVMDTPELSTDSREELIEILVKRDLGRGEKVGRKAIEKYVDRYLNKTDGWIPNWITPMSPEEFAESLKFDSCVEDFNHFDRVKIIGDIHGDLGALEKVFKDHKKGTAYVFVGDYLDRGNKNQEVLNFMNELKGNNIFLLRGNHEWSMEHFVNNDERTGNFGSRTLSILRENYSDDDALKKDLKKLQKRLRNYVLFDFHGKRYFVTHAGVEPLIIDAAVAENTSYFLPFANEEDFVMGVSSDYGDPYNEDVDKNIQEAIVYDDAYSNLNLVQIHGHRNEFNHFAIANCAINLTRDGRFRWVTIGSCGMYRSEIDSIDGETFVSKLFSDENIRNVELEDGIVAHNFTREAFRKGIWNNMTTHARGLFTKGDKIIGRGFKKFFYEGQNEEASLGKLVFPVRAYKKHNGFLAIAFIDEETGKVYIKSKGGGELHSNLAEEKVKECGMYKGLCKYLNDYPDTSVLFEIIDPKHDPHIVHYTNSYVAPLTVIINDRDGRYDMDLLERFTVDYINHNVSSDPEFIAYDKDDLIKKKTIWMSYNPTEEGLVLYDSCDLMIKEKTDFYNKAKELRRAMEKQGKINYKYGAKEWYQVAKQNGFKKFTPELALDLWKEDSLGFKVDIDVDPLVETLNETVAKTNDLYFKNLHDKKRTLVLKDDIEFIKFDGSREMAKKYSLRPWAFDPEEFNLLKGLPVSTDDCVIVKNGKAIYVTALPLFDIFEQPK